MLFVGTINPKTVMYLADDNNVTPYAARVMRCQSYEQHFSPGFFIAAAKVLTG